MRDETPAPASPLLLPGDPSGDPLAALAGGGVMAVITAVAGPHYRTPGTMMAFPAAGGAVGQLSSGCIEADLALHAQEVAREGGVQRLIYGAGSPFADLTLPCGGRMEVAVIAVADPAAIRAALARRAERQASALRIDLRRGRIEVNALDSAVGPGAPAEEDMGPATLVMPVLPPTRFLVWGAGVEAASFAALARAAGYPAELTTHDERVAAAAAAAGVAVRRAGPVEADPFSAVTLFYHDHDREPPVLAEALQSPAFYVGAQGSLRAHNARLEALRAMGLPHDALARLRGPIGLVPSARDPRVLAVSVLAEILAEAAQPVATLVPAGAAGPADAP